MLKLNRIRPYDTLHDFEWAFQVQVTGGAQPVLARAGGLGGMCLTEVVVFVQKQQMEGFSFFVSHAIYIIYFMHLMTSWFAKKNNPRGHFRWEVFGGTFLISKDFQPTCWVDFWPKLDLGLVNSFTESSPKCLNHSGGYRRIVWLDVLWKIMHQQLHMQQKSIPISQVDKSDRVYPEAWVSGVHCIISHVDGPVWLTTWNMLNVFFLKNKLLTLPDFSHQQWIMSSNLLLVTTLLIPLLNATQSHTFPSIHGGLKQELIH